MPGLRLARLSGAFALQLGTTVGGSLFAIFSARALGPHDRGLVVLALVTVQMAAQFSTMGINQSARTTAAREGIDAAWGRWRPRRPLVSVVALIAGLGGAVAVLQPRTSSGAVLAAIVALATVFACTDIVLRDALHGAGAHARAQSADVLMWLTALTVLAILAVAGATTAVTVAGALLVGYSVQWLALSVCMPRSTSRNGQAFVLHPTTFFSNAGQYALMRVDKLLVGVVVSAGAVGLYSAASTLAELAWIPCLLIAQMAARASATGDRSRLMRLRALAVACVVAWAVVCVPLGGDVIRILFGEGFEGAGSYLLPRVISAGWYGLAYIELAVLVSVARERAASIVSWAGVALTAAAVGMAPVLTLEVSLWVAAAVAVIVTAAAMVLGRSAVALREG